MEPVTSPRNRVASHFVRLTANYVGTPPSRPLLVLALSLYFPPEAGKAHSLFTNNSPPPWYSSASSAPLAIQQRQRHFIHGKLPSIISVGPYEAIDQEFSLSVLDVPCLEGSAPSTNPIKYATTKEGTFVGTRIHNNTQYTHNNL